MPSLPLQPCARCKRVLVPKRTARCPSCLERHLSSRELTTTPEEKARRLERDRADAARRGNSNARGYDSEWRALAETQLKAKPWCKCGKKASIADHVVPVKVAPERRLDPTNLQSLCRSCHQRKTATEGPSAAQVRGNIANHCSGTGDRTRPVVLARLPPPENRPSQSAPEKTE